MKFIGTYIDDTMKWISVKIYAAVTRFGSVVAAFTLALLVLVTVFWLALSLHLAFVHAFLPVQSHEWPLHLDFSTCPHRPGLCSEAAATVALQDNLSGEVPTPYLHHQLPPGNANRGNVNSQACPRQHGDGTDRQREKRSHAETKRDRKRGGKSERRGDIEGDEELLQRWQEILDMEDISSLPSQQEVIPEEFEAALEQRRMRRLKLFHEAKSTMEEELNAEEDQFSHSALFCSKPSCSSSPDKSASVAASLFARGQRYSISVHLEMPDSEANRRLGMFPIEVSLLDGNQAPLTTVRRPVLLPYRSSEQRFAWSLLQVPSLIVRDSYPETHELELVLFESFVDDPLQPAKFISVTLRSRFVQVSSCRVSVVASFSGLRRLLHRHPLLSAAVGTLTNMALLLAAITVCWLRRMENAGKATTAVSSGPRTTSPAVTNVSMGGLGRSKVEDLLQEERDMWDRRGAEKDGVPAPLTVVSRDGGMKDALDSEEDDSDREGENMARGGGPKRLLVLPEDSLMGGGANDDNKRERMRPHDLLTIVTEQRVDGAVQTDDMSSLSSSPRSSREHTDDEFTVLPTQYAEAGLRQRTTTAHPSPTETTHH